MSENTKGSNATANDDMLVSIGFKVDEKSIEGVIKETKQAVKTAQIEANKDKNAVTIELLPDKNFEKNLNKLFSRSNLGKPIEIQVLTKDARKEIGALNQDLGEFNRLRALGQTRRAGRGYIEGLAQDVKITSAQISKIRGEANELFHEMTNAQQKRVGREPFQDQYIQEQKLIKLRTQAIKEYSTVSKLEDSDSSFANINKRLDALRQIEAVNHEISRSKITDIKFDDAFTEVNLANELTRVQDLGKKFANDSKAQIKEITKLGKAEWSSYVQDLRKQGIDLTDLLTPKGDEKEKIKKSVEIDIDTEEAEKKLEKETAKLKEIEKQLTKTKLHLKMTSPENEEQIADLEAQKNSLTEIANLQKQEIKNIKEKIGLQKAAKDGQSAKSGATKQQLDAKGSKKELEDFNKEVSKGSQDVATYDAKIKELNATLNFKGHKEPWAAMNNMVKKSDLSGNDMEAAHSFVKTYENFEKVLKKTGKKGNYTATDSQKNIVNLTEIYDRLLPVSQQYVTQIQSEIVEQEKLKAAIVQGTKAKQEDLKVTEQTSKKKKVKSKASKSTESDVKSTEQPAESVKGLATQVDVKPNLDNFAIEIKTLLSNIEKELEANPLIVKTNSDIDKTVSGIQTQVNKLKESLIKDSIDLKFSANTEALVADVQEKFAKLREEFGQVAQPTVDTNPADAQKAEQSLQSTTTSIENMKTATAEASEALTTLIKGYEQLKSEQAKIDGEPDKTSKDKKVKQTGDLEKLTQEATSIGAITTQVQALITAFESKNEKIVEEASLMSEASESEVKSLKLIIDKVDELKKGLTDINEMNVEVELVNKTPSAPDDAGGTGAKPKKQETNAVTEQAIAYKELTNALQNYKKHKTMALKSDTDGLAHNLYNEEAIKNYITASDKLVDIQNKNIANDLKEIDIKNKLYQIETDLAAIGAKGSDKERKVQQLNLESNNKEIDRYIKKLNTMRTAFTNKNVAPDNLLGSNYKKITDDIDKMIVRLNKLKHEEKDLGSSGFGIGNVMDTRLNSIKQEVDNYSSIIKQYNRLSNINTFSDNKAFIESQEFSTGKVDAYGNAVQNVQRIYEELTIAIDKMQRSSDTEMDSAANKVAALRKELQLTQREAMGDRYNIYNESGKYAGEIIPNATVDANNVSKSLKEIANAMNEGAFETKKFDASNNTLHGTLKTTDGLLKEVSLSYDKTTRETRKTMGAEKEYLSVGQRWIQDFRVKLGQITQYVSAISMVTAALRALKNGVVVVQDVDKALINLRKTSEGTKEEYRDFIGIANDAAKAVGGSTSAVIESAASWSRLGYTLKESAILAENTALYMNVADIDDATAATEYLTSTLKGFNIEVVDSIDVIDKINEVSNNYAISAEGLGQALTRSSAALVASGNTFDESIGMITAGIGKCA